MEKGLEKTTLHLHTTITYQINCKMQYLLTSPQILILLFWHIHHHHSLQSLLALYRDFVVFMWRTNVLQISRQVAPAQQ